MEVSSLFAYLDAGTGSIIIQSIVGVTAGVAVFGRRMIANSWHKTKSFFSRDPQARESIDKP